MLLGLSFTHLFLYAFAGVALDWLCGEPRRWHPLVGFGRLTGAMEARLNSAPPPGPVMARCKGLTAVAVLVAPPVALGALACAMVPSYIAAAIHVGCLYLALGARSLWEHVRPIAAALASAELPLARSLAARIVSRDMDSASAEDVAKASVESTLENGNDAVFGTLFWFVIAGAPGTVAFRLVNTLDAMWGYKTPRFIHFGWAAARLDDVLNLAPARFTAMTYALAGRTSAALSCWRLQASRWKSPNAGPVMAAGAGALGVKLGGAAKYHGAVEQRPVLGTGRVPGVTDIRRAFALVFTGVVAWLALLALLAVGEWGMVYAGAWR